jgi:uncharacterized Zn-finger protein
VSLLNLFCGATLTISPVCDKRFNRPSSLSTHMAVHTGAKRKCVPPALERS